MASIFWAWRSSSSRSRSAASVRRRSVTSRKLHTRPSLCPSMRRGIE